MIALVDCNSFFCSCERLFRPDLERRPVGVLSNNDGCFISRTPELKKLGVPMAAPYFKYRHLCEKNSVAVFSANFALYSNISHRVMQVLSRFSPNIEIYSIDEAFIDLSGIPKNDLVKLATKIKQEVMQEVGIPVSVGVAKTKVLSKAANHLAKKSKRAAGIVVLDQERYLEHALKMTPVEELWGVGRKSAEKLNTIGINSALDLRNYQNKRMIQKLLTKNGRMIQDELKQISCFAMNSQSGRKQQILCSRSFGTPVYTLANLRESVANFATSVAQRLREQKSCCRQISVFCHTSPFKNTPQYSGYDTYTFNTPIDDSLKLISTSWELLDKVYRGGIEYSKAGGVVGGIVDSDQIQLSLFNPVANDHSEKLMSMIDMINAMEGDRMIRSAACGIDNQAWKMKQKMRSPRYLSSWVDLPPVS